MNAVEIEHALLQHPAVQAAAVIGVPDALRGLVVKAFILLRLGNPPAMPRAMPLGTPP